MQFSKPITEIIKKRFSCRTYLDKPIEGEKRQLLEDFMASCQVGPSGAPVRFKLVAATERDWSALKGLGTYGFIKGATGFVVGAMGDSGKNLEDFGYLMECIILFATSIDLGTCWLGGTFTKSSFARKVSPGEGESVPAVTSVGYISDKPRRIDTMIRQRAGSHGRLPWERLFLDKRFGAPLPRQAAGEYAVPLEMVRLGPSASNKQPWRVIKDGNTWHFYLQRTRGYAERNSRFLRLADLQRVDMGIAMSHFELTAGELGLEGRWEIKEPGIAKPDELTEYTVSWNGKV